MTHTVLEVVPIKRVNS